MSFKKFVHNNLVAIVIIPTIIAVHWGCNKIQNMDQFVSESERKDMPIIRVSYIIYLIICICMLYITFIL